MVKETKVHSESKLVQMQNRYLLYAKTRLIDNFSFCEKQKLTNNKMNIIFFMFFFM